MSGDVAILDVAAMGSIRSLLISGSKFESLCTHHQINH